MACATFDCPAIVAARNAYCGSVAYLPATASISACRSRSFWYCSQAWWYGAPCVISQALRVFLSMGRNGFCGDGPFHVGGHAGEQLDCDVILTGCSELQGFLSIKMHLKLADGDIVLWA